MTSFAGDFQIAYLIDKTWEQKQARRFHIGASIIGAPCARATWYSWRWFSPMSFDGRMLRLFDRGNLEEHRFRGYLEDLGVNFMDTEEEGSLSFSCFFGHFQGTCDDVILSGLPGFEEIPHLAEYKTHNDKSFKHLTKYGLQEAKPQHWAQMQVYMGELSLARGLYCAVNKNDDDLYFERVRYDKDAHYCLKSLASDMVQRNYRPARVGESEAWWQCKMCQHLPVCHRNHAPVVTCRSCIHSAPSDEGDASWWCSKNNAVIPREIEVAGCFAYERMKV
jgi:hypothetical protein